MKKFAYTLAEVLIAMSIIGVIAAIAAPAISNARPDANKFLVLKYYDYITKLSQEIASNQRLYLPISTNTPWGNGDNFSRNVSNFPLLDFSRPMDNRFNGCQGRSKFGCILAEAMGGTNVTYNGNDVTFFTPEGRWEVYYQSSGSIASNDYGAYYRVIIDTDTSDGNWRMYDRANPNAKHDTYEFDVNTAGSTVPGDWLSQMYVDTRLVTTSSRRINELVEEGIRAGRYHSPNVFPVQFNRVTNQDCPSTN